MTADAVLEAAWVLNRRTVERARRLVVALRLVRSGVDRRDACLMLREQFGIGQPEAWRLHAMATDMAGKEGTK